MIKNYFKLAWRSLLKNKMSSTINILGLAIGLATGIIMMLWITDEISYDKFHPNLSSIYQLMQNEQRSDGIHTGSATSGPLASMLRNEMPEIKYAARVGGFGDQLLRVGEKSIYEHGIYAEPDFFRIMHFPVVAGDPVTALKEAGSIVITESTAAKLFGKENPIGKILTHNNIHAFKVGAVIRDIPENSSNRFDVVLPFTIFEQENDWLNRWDYNALNTWVELKPGAEVAGLNHKLKKLFLQKQNDSTTEAFVYPLADLHLHGSFKNGKPDGGRIELIMMLEIVGMFVLLIACINFMNLATARSEFRAREVGVRKVLGSSRKLIIFQFLSEALLMTFIALLLGIIMAKLFLPVFNSFTEKNISFDFLNFKIWFLLIVIGSFTGLVAGSYPAFFLSSFQPVKVLKGMVTPKKGGSLLRKVLVTFQFMIAVFLIVTTIVIFTQINYVQKRPVGYDQENLIDIPARGDMAGKFDIVKNDLIKIPGVKSVSAGSDDILGFGGATNDLQWPGKRPDQNFMVILTWVQYDWTKTAGLQMVAGRDFSPEYGSDSLACLLNETAVRKMGLKEPVVGTKMGNSTVIGVVKDFMFNNPTGPVGPMYISLGNKNFNHFFVRLTNNEHWQQAISAIEQAVKKTNPNFPFEFHFTKEDYQKRFIQMRSAGYALNIVGGLAIFISCLGLFGLSAFLAERRSKEIGIRKVLGANVTSIWFSLSKDFLKPVFLAFVLAAPLAAFAMQKMLSTMDYHIALSWWIFAFAGLLAISIAAITVSYQGVKAALANPVKSLRAE